MFEQFSPQAAAGHNSEPPQQTYYLESILLMKKTNYIRLKNWKNNMYIYIAIFFLNATITKQWNKINTKLKAI